MPEISSPRAGLSIGGGPTGAPTGAPGRGRPSRMRIDRLGTTWMIIAVVMAVVTLFLHRRIDVYKRQVLEADVVRRSHIVVVLLGREDRVVVAGEIRGFRLGEGSGNRALEPNRCAGLRSNIAIDGVAGDPFTIGKGDVGRLGVVGDNVVTLVGPVFESPAALIFVARCV